MPFSLVATADWSFCRMDHTIIGAVSVDEPPAPFHHLALPMGLTRPRLGLVIDGRFRRPNFGPDEILAVEAGSSGQAWWDDPFESACFYFSPDAIAGALGWSHGDHDVALHTTSGLHAPILVHLLQALHADAVAGQPHGRMVGDAIFTAIAAQFAASPKALAGPEAGDWRVRRAVDYIHAHLCEKIDLTAIAAAAATSPYHLGRSFRTAMGCTIWRYVLKHRARRAETLMRHGDLSLTDIAYASGFETYSSFVAAIRQEYGVTPMALRRTETQPAS